MKRKEKEQTKKLKSVEGKKHKMNKLLIISLICIFPFYVGVLATCFYIGRVYAIRIIFGKNKDMKGKENGKKDS